MALEFTEGMTVKTADGDTVGHINRIVVDPLNGNISHVIVEKGFLFTEDRIIPVDMFLVTDDDVRLNASVKELEDFPLYEEDYYVTSHGYQEKPYLDWSMRPLFYYPPVGREQVTHPNGPRPEGYVKSTPDVEEDKIVISEGTQVLSLDDDHLGDVEKVITNDQRQITHFVISKGIIFTSERLIPIGWVRQITDGLIRLHVPNETVENLPEYTN